MNFPKCQLKITAFEIKYPFGTTYKKKKQYCPDFDKKYFHLPGNFHNKYINYKDNQYKRQLSNYSL